MRVLPFLRILGLGVLAAAFSPEPAAAAARAVVDQPLPLPQIVLAFPNAPLGIPAPAGANAPSYGGSTYMLGQSAHRLAASVARQYGLTEVASWPIRQLAVHCVLYEVRSGDDVRGLLARLAADKRVTVAEPLQQYHTLTGPPETGSYNDPLYDLQTNLHQLDIARAHQRSRGEGVRVGLIDTGVDLHHPDLRGRIAAVRSFVSQRPASPRAYRHGTAMAGLIAAVANNHIGIVGIAPQARLEVFEACWQPAPDVDDAVCNTFTLARALGAALDAGVPIINLSISGPPDPLLAMLVRVGLTRGVIYVAAAAQPAEGFPSAIAGVLVAGSVQHPTWPAQLTAPADHVFTLAPQGEYDLESGTSVAAAEVSGATALLLSASGRHLAAGTLVTLLTRAGMQPANAPVPALNINDALARLDDPQRLAADVRVR